MLVIGILNQNFEFQIKKKILFSTFISLQIVAFSATLTTIALICHTNHVQITQTVALLSVFIVTLRN